MGRSSHPTGECMCDHCVRRKEREEAEIRKKQEKEEQRQQRHRDLEAEQARIERLKEENLRIAAENRAKEQAAIQARQNQRETIGDTVNILIDNLKSKLAAAKSNKGSRSTTTTIAELMQLIDDGKARLDERCEDGSNLVSVKFGRDKLVVLYKKAVAFMKSIDASATTTTASEATTSSDNCSSLIKATTTTTNITTSSESVPISDPVASPASPSLSSSFYSPATTTNNSAASTPMSESSSGNPHFESGRKLLFMLHRNKPKTEADSTNACEGENSSTNPISGQPHYHSEHLIPSIKKEDTARSSSSSSNTNRRASQSTTSSHSKAENQKSFRGRQQKPPQVHIIMSFPYDSTFFFLF